MAFHGASVTQLPHHHLPPTSWWAGETPKQEHLNWESELGPVGWPERAACAWIHTRKVEQCQHPKAEIATKLRLCPSQRESGKAVASPSSQFSLAASEEGLRPTIRAEWSCSPLLLCCKGWLCIFGGKMPVLPHGCLLPRSFPGGNPCNCASTCWDRKMLLITGSRG